MPDIRMKTDLNPAFILHRRPYRETSFLLDVFTRTYGRISLIARGVRKKHSDKVELLQPYQRLQLAWAGKSELMTLTHVELDKKVYSLTQDRLLTGFYLNELITRILHQHEAHPELFDIYDHTLGLLSKCTSKDQGFIRIFEKRLLESVGYGLVLDYDADTGKKIEPEIIYYYQIERGPSAKLPDGQDYITICGQTLIELESETIDSTKTMQETKLLMRYVLQKYTGPKPLLSRELYKSFLSGTQPGY